LTSQNGFRTTIDRGHPAKVIREPEWQVILNSELNQLYRWRSEASTIHPRGIAWQGLTWTSQFSYYWSLLRTSISAATSPWAHASKAESLVLYTRLLLMKRALQKTLLSSKTAAFIHFKVDNHLGLSLN